MKKLYRFLVVAALACSSLFAKAQNDGVVFTLLPQMPYSNYLNPGIRVPYRGIVGLGISNINMSIYNSSVKYSNIYGTNANGEEVIDGLKFINSLQEQDNYFNFNMSVDLVNAGFRVGKVFVNIDWRMRISSGFQFSRDFLGFFVLGNGNYMGTDNPCDFNIGIDATMFQELGAAVQYDVNDKLTVGIRPKLLGGIANMTVTNTNTKIYTDPNTYAITADVDLNIQAASVMKSDVRRISDITTMLDNMNAGNTMDFKENIGFGVDFGASYKINNNWGVAAGVYDLGYIKWKDAKEKKVQKSGVSVNEHLIEDYKDLKDMKLDYATMLNNVVDAVWGNDSLESGGKYKTTLQTRIMLQGYYELNPMVRFTAIGQLYKMRDGMKPAFTLSYSGLFWNHLNLALSYTLSKYTGNALGFGVGFHAGPFNIYAVSDNLLALTKMTGTAVEFATAYKTSGFRFGVVFSW